MAKRNSSIRDAASSVANIANAFADALGEAASKVEDKVDSATQPSASNQTVDLTCKKCGASMKLDLDNLKTVCPYCGDSLMLDVRSLKGVLTEREKTKRQQMEYEHERELRRERDARRPGKIKASIVLGIIGVLMMFFGDLAGSATGDSNSAFYTLSLLGMFPLLAIPFVWLSDDNNSKK